MSSPTGKIRRVSQACAKSITRPVELKQREGSFQRQGTVCAEVQAVGAGAAYERGPLCVPYRGPTAGGTSLDYGQVRQQRGQRGRHDRL